MLLGNGMEASSRSGDLQLKSCDHKKKEPETKRIGTQTHTHRH